MSKEQQQSNTKLNKLTPITRTWRLGGPMTVVQRKDAKALFVESLKVDPNVSAACDLALISRVTAYQWREKDAVFADDWEDALERTRDTARSSIYTRAIIGWDEPLTSMGKPVYDADGNLMHVHKWSDTLANSYAKANLPEYKDKQQIDLNAQITTMAESAKDDLLADLAAAVANENKEPSNQE